MRDLVMTGQGLLSPNTRAANAGEGRWPRICETAGLAAILGVRCDHEL